jgi:CHAD domain-containing protein
MIIPLEKHPEHTLTETVTKTAESVDRELIFAAQLSKENLPESVHLIRKRLKLYRALLKLLKHRGNPGKFTEANAALRDLGRVFSELRDDHVRSRVLENFHTEQVFSSYTDIVGKLQTENTEQTELLYQQLSANGCPFKVFTDTLNQKSPAASFIESLNGRGTFEEGFVTAYEKASNAYYSCFLYPSAELMHEWRKRIKDLQYQCELMPWITETTPGTFYQDLITLAELLGEDQDINNLMNWIYSKPGLLDDDETSAIFSILKSRRNKLKGVIDHIGKTLFREDPTYLKSALMKTDPDGI